MAHSKHPVRISIPPSSGLGTRKEGQKKKKKKEDQEAPGEGGWMRKSGQGELGLKSRKGSGQEAA